jgi:hypothetical protein
LLQSWEASHPYIESSPACSLPLASPASGQAKMAALHLKPGFVSFIASSLGAFSWGCPYRIGLKGLRVLESLVSLKPGLDCNQGIIGAWHSFTVEACFP